MRGFYLIISFFEKRNIRFDKRLYDTAAAKAADKAKAYKTLYCGNIGDAGVILCGACFSRADRNILFNGIVYNISFAYDIYEYFLKIQRRILLTK